MDIANWGLFPCACLQLILPLLSLKSQNFLSESFYFFFSLLLCTFLYGSNFIRDWKRALDGKDNHVVSILLCPSPLIITEPCSSKWSHWSQGNCLSPSLRLYLHEGFKYPTVELKPKDNIVLLWQSGIFYYSLTLLSFSSTTSFSFWAAWVHSGCLYYPSNDCKAKFPQACSMGSGKITIPWKPQCHLGYWEVHQEVLFKPNIKMFQCNILNVIKF